MKVSKGLLKLIYLCIGMLITSILLIFIQHPIALIPYAIGILLAI